MSATASPGGVMAGSHRGNLHAVLAMLPVLSVVALMLSASIAFAGSSILEIETPSHEDARHRPASPSQKISNPETNQHCDGQKADDEDDDSASDANIASAQASNDDDDDADARAGDPREAEAESNKTSDCAQKDSNAADSDDADDDSDDDSAPASADEKRPSLETRIDHETDSDHNDTVTTSTIASALIDDYSVTLRRDSVAAHDHFGSERTESTVFSIHKDLSETFGLDGGFGTIRSDRWSDFVGSFQAQAKILGTEITASVAREFAASQAEAIRSRVRQTNFGLSASYDLTKQLSSEFEFHHKLYSDHNSSNEFEWTPQYTFDIHNTKLELGYKFNYTAFARNTDHGYWAPQRVFSHNIFTAWAFDWVRAYGRLELSAGPDFVREVGKQSSGPTSGGFGASASAALGFRPTENIVIECTFSRDESPGWQSTATGVRLKYLY